MAIKSLAEFKRNISIGKKVAVTYHLKNDGIDEVTSNSTYRNQFRPVRTVIEANTSSFTMATNRYGKWEGRKVKYPKASQCQFRDDILIIMGKDLDNPRNKKPIQWLSVQVIEENT